MTKKQPLNSEILQSLINTIYDATLDITKWRDFFLQLAPVLNATGGSVFVYSKNQKAVSNFLYNHNIDDNCWQAYNNHFHTLDLMGPRLAQCNTNGTLLLQDCFNLNIYKKSEMYNDYMNPYLDHFHAGAHVISQTKDSSFVIGFGRITGMSAFDEKTREIFKILQPHLLRASIISQKLENSRINNDINNQLVDQLNIGIALIDNKTKVISLNRKAEEIISSNIGLSIQLNKLTTNTLKNNHQLKQLLQQACVDNNKTSGAMQLDNLKNNRNIQLIISPLNQGETYFDIQGSNTSAMVMIHQPQTSTLSDNILSSKFHLTKSETDIMLSLTNGMNGKQICEQLCITKNTFKTHSKSIYRKTSTKNQIELIKLAMNYPHTSNAFKTNI